MRSPLSVILSVLLLAMVAMGAWLWTPDKSRAELDATYLNAPADYVDVAGLKLHVRDSGSKTDPAVILLHGLGSSLHTWEPWAQSLSGTHRVIRYDLPGFALTGADPARNYSEARGMEVLAALMDKLSIVRASIVGNSMGGRLAWNFAANYPQRIDKLVLISPDGFESPGYTYGKSPDVPALVKLMRYVLPKSFLRMNLAPAYADASLLSDAVVTRYHDLMLAPGVRDAMIARMGQTVLTDPVPALRRILAPTLLLWGEKDALIPLSNAADYKNALPNAELVTLPDLGHVPHEEAPAASLAPVQAFLAN
jgi:pimeloyl-ACP methyl ester carboxylesterase